MSEIIVRIRPSEVMEDLKLEEVRARAAQLSPWNIELQDTRLSDAPYVTLIITVPEINAEALTRLKTAFADLERMSAILWVDQGVQIPLAAATLEDLRQARAQK